MTATRTTTAPEKNRPSTHDDLPPWERDGQTVLRRPDYATPEQAEWYGNALAAAARAGFIIDRDMNVIRPITEAELNANLERVQQSYDRGRAAYIEWATTGNLPEYPWILDEYCKAEKINNPRITEKENQ